MNFFQVVLKQTKLPITLLQEKAKVFFKLFNLYYIIIKWTIQTQRAHIVDTESFEYTFGKKSLRKKPKLAVDTIEVR